MGTSASWYVKSAEGKVYGPADTGKLMTWAADGRIDSASCVSQDRLSWMPARNLPELGMKWLVETEPGKIYGPFNRAVAIRLFRENAVSPSARIYCLHEYAIDQDPPPVEKIVVKEVVQEVCVEAPTRPRVRATASRTLTSVSARPLAKVSNPLFANAGWARLAALEAAAQRELAAAQRKGRVSMFGIFGGKKK